MKPNSSYPDFKNDEINAEIGAKDLTMGEGIVFAAKQSGRSSFEIGKEFWRLSRGKGKITMTDYCGYRLFDSDLHSDDEKARFISDKMHWPIVSQCGDTRWFAVSEDKWLSSSILKRDTLNIPETLAVIDTGMRTYGTEITIKTPEQLKAFLTGQAKLPVFLKPTRGLASIGSAIITGADDDSIHFQTGDTMTYQAFLFEKVKNASYLLQAVIDNDPFIKKFTPNTATIRLQNLVANSGIITPFALLKIPAQNNVADNFWRKGNIICDLNLETGEILTALSGEGSDLQHHTHHPETGAALIGEVLPHWSQVREMNERCVKLFQPIRVQSLDVALTKSGPVIVENNFGGSMHLPQLASGRGFLTDEVQEFFRSCGVDLG